MRVIDLKAKAFEREFVGKMNFYLAAVDGLLRQPDDQPSSGLIICKRRTKPWRHTLSEIRRRRNRIPLRRSQIDDDIANRL